MTAEEQNFTMNEGETKKIEVAETEDEDDGGTLDMSTMQELTWVLKYDKGDTETIVEKTESGSSDVTLTDAANGGYTILIDSEDTGGVVAGAETELYHRVRFTDGNGYESDLLEGAITVEAI